MQTELCFDGHKVVVDYQDDDIAAVIDFLFHDLPRETVEETSAKLYINFDDEKKMWRLTHMKKSLFKGKNINGLANILMGETLFHLIKHNRHGMALHAALVSNSKGAILMPADSGAGKSSLTTWMLTNGQYYHTDELVIMNLKDHSIKAFTRPLNIKNHGVEAIKGIFNLGAYDDHIRVSKMVTMIPHRLVNANFNQQIPKLYRILFPKYGADSKPEIMLLSGAEAGLEMMRCNVIARNLPNHGFSQITKLVRDIPAYRVHYRSFDDLPKLLEDIV